MHGMLIARLRAMTFQHLFSAVAVAGILACRVPSVLAQTAAAAGALPLPMRYSMPAQGVNERYTMPRPMLYRVWYRYTLQSVGADQQFDVSTENGAVIIARCVGQCTLGLPEGRYSLKPYDKQGKAMPGTSFEVTGPGWLQFEPANTDLATAGAVIGSAGGVLIFAAAWLIMDSVCINECEDSDPRRTKARLALASLATGAITTPIGWYLFAHHIRPRVDTSPTRRVQLSGAVNRDGGFLGIKGSF